MQIRRVKVQDSEILVKLIDEGFGWSNKSDFSKKFFSNKNIFYMVAENDKCQIMRAQAKKMRKTSKI